MKFWDVMGSIGFVLMMLGGSGMDSECIIVPIVMLVTGLALLAGDAIYQERANKHKIHYSDNVIIDYHLKE